MILFKNLKRVSHLFPQIQIHFYIIIKKLDVRKCVTTKHNTIYFREEPNIIVILRIYDTRQNPDKLSFKINNIPK